MKKERIKVTFEFDIKYDTAMGRKVAISLARQCEKDCAQFGKYGVSISRITKKLGTIAP